MLTFDMLRGCLPDLSPLELNGFATLPRAQVIEAVTEMRAYGRPPANCTRRAASSPATAAMLEPEAPTKTRQPADL
jgi:hypothetical protein